MSEAYFSSSPFEANFRPEWQGGTSDKFGYNERKHYESRDMLKAIEGRDLPYLNRKHYDAKYGTPVDMKSSVKTFPYLINNESVRAEAPIKTKPEFHPTIKKYGHREKLHLHQEESGHQDYKATIKTFYPMERAHNERTVEKLMGQKKILDSLDEQRNLIGVRSMGDKKYKYPEYAPDFYKEGGLVPGSSITVRTTKKPLGKPIKEADKARGMTWKDRVKLEQLKEEEDAVKGLFEWEQTSLKEGNPKWRDPDTVEPELPGKQDAKAGDQKNKKAPAPAPKK